MGWAACAIRTNFQDLGDGIVARHRDTGKVCATGVTVLSCHLGPSRPSRQTPMPFSFFSCANFQHDTYPAVPESWYSPLKTRAVIPYVRGSRWVPPEELEGDSLGVLQEMLQLLPRAVSGAQTCMVVPLHIPHRDLLFCHASHATAAHARCQLAVRWDLGLSRNRLGAGSPH